MENGEPADGGVATMCLALGGRKSLTIGERHLVVLDGTGDAAAARQKSKKKTKQTGAPGKRLMPLYNILWVELSAGKIHIDYASQPSKKSIKPDRWTHALDAPAGHGAPPPEAFVAALMSRAYGEAQAQKRAYVLINPNAGPGGALRRWHRDVRPLFEAARMSMDVVTLTRGGEAVELAAKVDVDRYDTIVACSGDGTPHEVFNGLARRADARRALTKLAVSHVPCGSGNAMSCNLYGSHRPAFAALAIIKGVVTPLDLVSITQGDGRFISFLSQALGMVAESDLATEHLRWMGSARFDVGILTRVFRRRCYPCDVAIKTEAGDKDAVRAHYKHHTNDASPTKALAETGSVTHHDGPSEGLPPLSHGTIKDELPDGWELVPHDKMGTFYCGNMAYMAPDANFFSAAVASDGCMDLVTIQGDLSPVAATKTLMSIESGKFFDSPHVSYKKVSAYRIVPRNQEDGYISIDGERVPFEPFQAEVHRGLGRVISRRGFFEANGPANWDSVTAAEKMRA